MTDPEIQEWLSLLSKTREEQRVLVEDLLCHAERDEMSEEDLVDCKRGLELLNEQLE